MTPRTWAVVALIGLSVALLGLVAYTVPWAHPATPSRAAELAAVADLPADKVALGKRFAAALRPGSYAGLLLGLVVTLVLGLTPLGARLVAYAGRPFGGHWLAEALLGGLAIVLLGQVVVLLVALLSFVFPVLVEPIFNKFTPMPDSPLRTELMALAQRDGVPVKDVLVADASRRTTAVNAYVSGYGPTRRIVVYDTLLEAGSDSDVVEVVAHELGHAKQNDVVVGTVIGALGASAAVCGLYLLGSWSGLLRRAGLDGDPSDLANPRALALLIAVVTVIGLVSTPVQSLISRRIEARADEHALELTQDPVAFEKMQRRLALRNLSDVDPPAWEQWIFGDHPTTAERIAAARAYATR